MSNTKKAKPKRLLSLLLTLAMVLGMLPAMSMTAFAYSGSGTEADPYIVTDYDELRNLMVTAPKDGSTCYIKLGADVSNNQNVNGYELLCANGQCVDLDLNGCDISRTAVSDDAIFMVRGGRLTIRDSTGGGTVTSNLAGGSGNVVSSSDGDIIVEGGTFHAKYGYTFGIYGNLTVNGGTISSENDYCTIYVFRGSLTMNGGHVSNLNSKAYYTIRMNDDVDVRLNALTANKKIRFYSSGHMAGCIPWSSELTQGSDHGTTIKPDEETGLIEIVKDYYTPEGSGNAADPYVVTDGDLLERMFSYAPIDNTDTTLYIKLGADIKRVSNLSIGNERTNINLDLNGSTLNLTRYHVTVGRGSLTIGDSTGEGKLVNDNGVSYLFDVYGYGQLTINGGTYHARNSSNLDYAGFILKGRGNSSVTINGGAFYGYKNPEGYKTGMVLFSPGDGEEMTVVINNGQFYNNGYSGSDANVIVYNENTKMTMAGLMVEGRILKRNAGESSGILSDIPETSTLEVYGENFRDDNDDILTASTDHNGWIKITKNTPISYVNITDVVAPKVGETVDFSATVNTNGTVKAGVTWVDVEGKREMSAGETFQAEHSYMVVVTLTAKDGYAFNTTNDTLEIRINGQKGFLWYASGKKVQWLLLLRRGLPSARHHKTARV